MNSYKTAERIEMIIEYYTVQGLDRDLEVFNELLRKSMNGEGKSLTDLINIAEYHQMMRHYKQC